MKISTPYAPRAKGEGEGKRRAVSNLLTTWALNQIKLAVRAGHPKSMILFVSHPSAALIECGLETDSRRSA